MDESNFTDIFGWLKLHDRLEFL